MSRIFDVAVVGGGIVGLAVARELLRRRPDRSLLVIEKEEVPGTHQTSRNSGVLHSGVSYAPGSLKARLCTEGRRLMLDYCAQRSIPHALTGKLIVAVRPDEVPALERLRERGRANGLQGLEVLGPEGIREREPHARGLAALWVPESGIVDYPAVARSLAAEVGEAGGELRCATTLEAVESEGNTLRLQTSRGHALARFLLTCAGLQSDRVARLTTPLQDLRIVPFRGRWSVLRPNARGLVRGLIYPVPDVRFPFLGVHFTRRLDGEVWVGPNALLAFGREGYGSGAFRAADLRATLGWPGFWRLAARHWRFGIAELWRDRVRVAALRNARRYVPELSAADLQPGPCGIRAQAVRRDGTFADDFEFREGPRALHVVNAPSPAATAALAIAVEIADRTERALEGLR